ncbi:MAG: T3SS (YopN, CesT) and YbjN peptide-binding chaperone 1 [Chloroflexota bacterium]
MLEHGCETLAQEVIFGKITVWMREIFGEYAEEIEDQPAFAIQMGSCLVFLAVRPWGDNDATISISSLVVRQPNLTADLMHFLLNENTGNIFGRFGIDDDGDVVLDHCLVGSTCDKEEIRAATRIMISMADRYDDEITARWGGKRAADR